MKKTTVENKLNELLGLTKVAEEHKTKATGNVVGVTEPEIQEFREIQGVLYYLQAPALFQPRVCARKDCEESFLVSRKYVAYCSYYCIQKALADQGLNWRKGKDLELLAQDPQVYDGNEPIWIRKGTLERLEATLRDLSNILKEKNTTSSLSQPPNSLQESSTQASLSPSEPTTSTPVHTQTTMTQSVKATESASLRNKPVKKPKRIFKT